jgi:hypothetical protein
MPTTTATKRHGVHERPIIDELAASAAAKRELKAERIEDFAEDDLIGRNALAVRDLLFEGLPSSPEYRAIPVNALLNCFHRKGRRPEEIFIQRETGEIEPPAPPPSWSTPPLYRPTTKPSHSLQRGRTVSVLSCVMFRMAYIRTWSSACDLVASGDHAVPNRSHRIDAARQRS